MDRLVIVLSAVFLITSVISEETHNDDRQLDAYSKRKSTALWFGPRLGRRKRNPNGEEYRTPALEREQLEAAMDMFQDSPWTIVAVNGDGKRHTLNFTPRLGRESGEELINSGTAGMGGERWLQDSELAGELMSQRSPPFAPRLGRRVLPFSPRLGRETDRS